MFWQFLCEQVISQENTQRTREIQQARMLESRAHTLAPRVPAGSVEEGRAPTAGGLSHRTSLLELLPPEAVAMPSQTAEFMEEGSEKTGAGVKFATKEAVSFSKGFPMEASDMAAVDRSSSHFESKVSMPPVPLSSEMMSLDSGSFSCENPALDNLFRVFLVFQEMRSRGVRPDLRAYNALVNTCADVGEFERALGVVRQMVDDDHGGGLQPDVVTYTCLIKAAARANPPRVEEAEEVRKRRGRKSSTGEILRSPTNAISRALVSREVSLGSALFRSPLLVEFRLQVPVRRNPFSFCPPILLSFNCMLVCAYLPCPLS